MSILAVFIIGLFGFILAGSIYIALNNQETLGALIQFSGEFELAVWSVILWSFFVGFGLAFGLSAVRTSQHAYGRLKDARGARQRERVDHLFAEGLQAVLAEKSEVAEERFREVLVRDGAHFDTLMAMGDLLAVVGRPREAADFHRRAGEVRPTDMRPLFALASDWEVEGDEVQATAALERVISGHPKASLKARRLLRDLLVASEKWDEARKIHETIESATKEPEAKAKERGTGLGIRYEIALAHLAEGGTKEAEKELRAILKVARDFVPASLTLGGMLVEAGDESQGVKEWRRGFETTSNVVFLGRLEEHFLAREEPREIIELMQSMLETSSVKRVLSFYLGKLFLRLEMIDEAEATFSEFQKLASDSLLLRYFSAKIDERRGRLKEAATAYRGVIKDSMLLDVAFHCADCEVVADVWNGRCEDCGKWGTIQVTVPDEALQIGDQPAQRPQWAATS